MTTAALNRYKPFKEIDGSGIIAYLKAINYIYWLQRLPVFLLSTPAAYGVYSFASEHLPMPFNVFAGMAFECSYIGAITISDELYDATNVKKAFWYLLNFTAVLVSALINVLFASNNTFSGITAEALVHGVPFPILSLFYSMFLHSVTHDNIVRDYKKTKEVEDRRLAKEKFEQDNPFLCECGRRFTDNRRRASHRRSCIDYQNTIK